jgi:riboflavin transporter FmnP
MDTKTLAQVAVFGAITVVLNLSPIKFAAPFAFYLFYQIWEIPIVAAFLLYGFKAGFSISIINTVVLLAVFPGASPTGPFYNLAAVLSMLLGLYLVYRFVGDRLTKNRSVLTVVIATAVGIVTRVGIMSIFNWFFLRFPPPFGFGLGIDAIPAELVVIGLFNATLTLYTIPIGILIARAVSQNTKTTVWSQPKSAYSSVSF